MSSEVADSPSNVPVVCTCSQNALPDIDGGLSVTNACLVHARSLSACNMSLPFYRLSEKRGCSPACPLPLLTTRGPHGLCASTNFSRFLPSPPFPGKHLRGVCRVRHCDGELATKSVFSLLQVAAHAATAETCCTDVDGPYFWRYASPLCCSCRLQASCGASEIFFPPSAQPIRVFAHEKWAVISHVAAKSMLGRSRRRRSVTQWEHNYLSLLTQEMIIDETLVAISGRLRDL